MAGLLSLGPALLARVSENKSAAYLQALTEKGDPDDVFGSYRFQYFPETVADTKAVNWANREIPGASLPIYQWVASGERALSFTAAFTSDIDLLSAAHEEDADSRFNSLKSAAIISRNVDLRAAVAWLRYFLYPSYGTVGPSGVPYGAAPKKLKLILPGSGIGISGGTNDGHDEMLSIMTQCDITYEMFFPSGYPRIITASMAFVQTGQLGANSVVFPSSAQLPAAVKGGGSSGTLGYPLTVQKEAKK